MKSSLTAKELIASPNNALAANHIPAELALIESRIGELNRVMRSIRVIRKGGVIFIDYLPGRGTRITVNGKEKDTIKGEEFFQALLRIWIGRKPVDGRLRDSMLGGAPRSISSSVKGSLWRASASQPGARRPPRARYMFG